MTNRYRPDFDDEQRSDRIAEQIILQLRGRLITPTAAAKIIDVVKMITIPAVKKDEENGPDKR